MKKEYLILTRSEKNKVLEIIYDILNIPNLAVSFEDLATIHSMQRANSREEKWDEYVYTIATKLQDNNLDNIYESFSSARNLFESAWLIAYFIFKNLGLSYESEQAKRLWEMRAELREKYKKYEWENR